MTRFLSSDFWQVACRTAKTAKVKRVAVAYFTQDHFKLRKGDILVTDATDGAIGAGQTDAQLLSELHKRGVQIFSCPGLHAKVAVLDGMVFVSSANCSSSSSADGGLIEAGVLVDSEPMRTAALSFIDQLVEKSKTSQVDDQFLMRILRISVKGGWNPGVKGANSGVKPVKEDKKRFWMMNTVPAEDPEDPEELETIARGEELADNRKSNARSESAWARWPASSRIARHCKPDDVVIVVAGQQNNTGHANVEHHARILHKEPYGKSVYIFYEPSLHRSKKPLRWTEFKRLAMKCGIEAPRGKYSLTQRQASEIDAKWNSVKKRLN